jgi:hypothetical protein
MASATVSASATLTPGDQARGWQRRWADIQRELARLLEPRTVPLSAEGVGIAERELLSFYVLAYHLKDLLKMETTAPGIEKAITNTPALALLCDLANLDKHGHLKDEPRSNHRPEVVKREGTTGSGAGGWRLDVTIQHGPDARDGLEVAREAVDAWRQLLTGWSLI